MLVAERLQLVSRDTDLIGRLGGDEFLVVLRDVRGEDWRCAPPSASATSLCGDFRAAHAAAPSCGASIGVACSSGEQITAEELVKRADAAMYESKDQGECLPVLASAAKSARGPRLRSTRRRARSAARS